MNIQECYTDENTKDFPEQLLVKMSYEINGQKKNREFMIEKSDMIGKTRDELMEFCGSLAYRIDVGEQIAKTDIMRLEANMNR